VQQFDDIDGEFVGRLRQIATTTRTTVDNSTVTFRTARIECEYTPKVIKHLAMGQLVAIPNVQALGANSSYSLYEVADVYPMHYSMLSLDQSQPAAIRTEFMDLIQKEWEKGSKSTWIEIVAAPISYVMKASDEGVTYERRAMAPLTGSPVKLLSKDSIQQLICFRPTRSTTDNYVLGHLLGFTDDSIPFSVNLESLIHYMAGVFAFSLDHSEPIIYRRDGKVRIGKIGELVDGFFPDSSQEGRAYTSTIEALSFDSQSLEVKWSPVQYVFRHRYGRKLLRFHARTGRTVTVTPGHSLFSLRNGRIECIPSDELRPGDYLVGSRLVPTAELGYASFDLLELCRTEGKGFVLTNLPKFSSDLLDSGVPKWKRWYWRHRGFLPISYWDRLNDSARSQAKLAYKGRIHHLPLAIEIDEDMARLLGYYAAEGHVAVKPGISYSVQFTLHAVKDAKILHELKRILLSKFGIEPRVTKHGKNAIRVTFNHRILTHFIDSVVGRGARNKRVPDLILNSKQSVRRAFIESWAEGDYCTTTSSALMNGVMHLMMMDKTVATVGEYKGNGTAMIEGRLVKSNPRFQMYFPSATEIAIGNPRSRRNRAEPTVPVAALPAALHSMVYQPTHHAKQKSRFDGKVLQQVSRRLEALNSYVDVPTESLRRHYDHFYTYSLGKYLVGGGEKVTGTQLLMNATSEFETVKGLVESDLAFYEIESIEEVDSTSEFVYDVSVPGAENFLAGFGGVFCHNTGSGKSNLTATVIRKAIRAIPDLKVVIFDVSAEYGVHIIDVLNELPSRILFTDSFKDSKNLPAEYFKRHATPEGLAGMEKEFQAKISELFRDGKVEFLPSRLAGEEDVARFSTYEGLVEVLSNTLNDRYGTVQQKILVPQVVQTIKQFLKQNDLDLETRFSSKTSELIGKIQPLLADLDNRSSLKKTFDSLATVVDSIPDVSEEPEGYTWNKLAEEILSTSKDSPRVFVVNLPEAEDARLETANVINEVFRKRKRGFTLTPRVLFVIDEAQEFIPQAPRKEDGTDQSSRAVEKLLRHGRKYHLNCWISTQRVAHLNTNALQQLHSYFVSTMPRPYDRQLISDTFAIDDAFMERTLAFQNGDWLLTSFKATATQNIPVFFHAENNEDILTSYLK
jgi:Intein splicing domain/LAGLIDADG-like domain/Helicase HerA, central domain